MSYATLMVYVDPDFTRGQIVPVAVQLADQFASNLIGVSAMPIKPPVVAGGVILSMVTNDQIEQMTERLQAKEVWFRERSAASHRATDWRSELDLPTEFLIAQSRCADLIVLNPNRELRDAYTSVDAAAVVLRTGRPVLVVPADMQCLRADRIVIGWKETREARRAIADALPFMHEATRITVAVICEEGDEISAQRGIDDIVQYLARHRIKAGPKVFLHREGSSAAGLVRLAQDEGADLLVTGAYGHSRLGEWVFGGVTHELLATSPICCLMSH